MTDPIPTPTALRWSLCLVTFSAALEYPDKFPAEVTTLTGAFFLTITLAYPSLVYARVTWPAICFGLWLVVQLFATAVESSRYPGGFDPVEVSTILQLELLWVLFFAAAANLLRDPRLCRDALLALAAGCLIRAALPIAGIARTIHIEGTGEVRLSVFGQNPNQSAQVLAVGLLSVLGLAHFGAQGRALPRVAVWAAAGLLGVGIIQTGSRGGLASLLVGLVVLLGGGGSWRARARSLVLASLAIAAMAGLAWQSDLMRTRILKAAEAGDLAQRERIFPALIGMIGEKPLLGWGPSTNKYELASRLGDPRYGRRDPHNAILEVLSATGLLGLIPFLVGVGMCLRAGWVARSGPYGFLPLAILMAVLAGNMSGNRLAFPMLWFGLAYALGSSRLGPGQLPRRSSGTKRAPVYHESSVWGEPTHSSPAFPPRVRPL
jgi:O-antigen ligase